MQPKKSELMESIIEFGMSLLLPFAFSLMWMALTRVTNFGLVAALGCYAAFALPVARILRRDFRFLDWAILVIWALECAYTFNSSISVTRTTVLITAIVWGIILIKPFILSMKEMIDTIQPKGAIF